MSFKTLLFASVAFAAAFAPSANAADILEPAVVELPEPAPMVEPAHKGGWYLRGDVGYTVNGDVDVDYDVFGGTPPGSFSTGLLSGELRNGYSIGAGVGYDTGNHLRLDLTADYFSKANYSGNSSCIIPPATVPTVCSNDSMSMTALSLLANAYVDLGNFNGFTPYVGAGIGGTHVKWSELNNVCTPAAIAAGLCTSDTHPGESGFRFTYAAMAGVSYDVSDCVAIDAGYRYRKIEGGKTFGIASTGAPGAGHDRGLSSHDFRLGARYKLGGGNCGGHKVPDYQPEYQPVYK
jgi:opacity protein-like surface antigen